MPCLGRMDGPEKAFPLRARDRGNITRHAMDDLSRKPGKSESFQPVRVYAQAIGQCNLPAGQCHLKGGEEMAVPRAPAAHINFGRIPAVIEYTTGNSGARN